eukprot:3810998-Prorocentrum_lima.AAC.1
MAATIGNTEEWKTQPSVETKDKGAGTHLQNGDPGTATKMPTALPSMMAQLGTNKPDNYRS